MASYGDTFQNYQIKINSSDLATYTNLIDTVYFPFKYFRLLVKEQIIDYLFKYLTT